jgi:hypothetical protein
MSDTTTGPLRAIAPVILGWLVARGIDSVTAGFITAAVTSLLAAAWSYFTNRMTSLAAKVAATPGVSVIVHRDAPIALKTIAQDQSVPGIHAGLDLTRKP